ncbi:sensor histidine kinase [uncultured Brevundimonas sp.]|uniref:sensor histidine kinase n=1 Tax=uncultured Brevundimonas sp. TaxID=213418 RepID=UPI0030EC0A3C
MLRAETDHRVANHLMMLSSYVRLQGRHIARDGVVDRAAVSLFARSVDAQIHAIARLHRRLMTNVNDQSSDLGPLLHEVVACFAIDPETCAVVEDLDPACSVRMDQLLPISQIVNEAVTNSLKYAFRGTRPGRLTVRCLPLPSGDLRVEIGDNGDGLPAALPAGTDGGFGIGLMRDLARQLDASLAFDSGPDGLTVRLTVPRSSD